MAMGRPTALEHNWGCVDVLASPRGRTRSEMRPSCRPETNTEDVRDYEWSLLHGILLAEILGGLSHDFPGLCLLTKRNEWFENPIWIFSSKLFCWFHASKRLS